MPPQSNSPSLHLTVQSRPFFLVQFQGGARIPPAILDLLAVPLESSTFLSVTRSKDEVSIVSDFRIDGGTSTATEWRCLRVAGPMDLGLTGIMNDLTTPLKVARIPVFALSTWDTDWILVPAGMGKDAAEALRKDGWVVKDEGNRE